MAHITCSFTCSTCWRRSRTRIASAHSLSTCHVKLLWLCVCYLDPMRLVVQERACTEASKQISGSLQNHMVRHAAISGHRIGIHTQTHTHTREREREREGKREIHIHTRIRTRTREGEEEELFNDTRDDVACSVEKGKGGARREREREREDEANLLLLFSSSSAACSTWNCCLTMATFCVACDTCQYVSFVAE